ncbi:MAG TPA: hypothetical protein VGL27_14525 [Negativicutes bacterium]
MDNGKQQVKDEVEDSNQRKLTLAHVGGIDAELGGVNPAADEELIRLSGGE